MFLVRSDTRYRIAPSPFLWRATIAIATPPSPTIFRRSSSSFVPMPRHSRIEPASVKARRNETVRSSPPFVGLERPVHDPKTAIHSFGTG